MSTSSSFRLIGRGLAGLGGAALEAALRASPLAQKALSTLTRLEADVTTIRRDLMALTQAQQAAINDLSANITTLSENLTSVLAGARQTRDELVAMTAEEGREEAERTRLQGLIDQMDTDVIAGLTPLTQQVAAMNQQLITPADQGGSALEPEA